MSSKSFLYFIKAKKKKKKKMEHNNHFILLTQKDCIRGETGSRSDLSRFHQNHHNPHQ